MNFNIILRVATGILGALFCFSAFSQNTNCVTSGAGSQFDPTNTCQYQIWDIPNNGNYWTSYTGCNAAGTNDVWAWFIAEATTTTITYDPYTNFNPVIHVFTGTCSTGMSAIACSNAAGNNVVESLTMATTVGQIYMVRIEPRNISGAGLGDLCIVNTSNQPNNNTTCAHPTAVCSGSPIIFTANAGSVSASALNPGNVYNACLGSTPNPSWYYLEIDQAGELAIDITAGSDVDFKIWGPFPNLTSATNTCGNYYQAFSPDCSYSTSATEQANVSNVQVGEVYVLLVTNYANTVQTITINEAGSNTASTNCDIVALPVGFSFWDVSLVGDDVILMWETESEQNNSHFLVQRSADGLIWETIGIVKGYGTTSEQSAYSYRDQDPIAGMNYYRLNQLDMDGLGKLTSVLYINTIKRNDIKVFPNPSQGIFTVSANPKDVSEVYLTDMIGKRYQPGVSESGETIIVTTENIVKGIYNLVVTVKGERIVQKITLQ